MTWLEHITPFELILITTVIFICFGGSPRFRRKRKLIKLWIIRKEEKK